MRCARIPQCAPCPGCARVLCQNLALPAAALQKTSLHDPYALFPAFRAPQRAVDPVPRLRGTRSRAGGRTRQPRGGERGREGVLDHPPAGHRQALEQAGTRRGQRQRRHHRGQAHPHQRARRGLRQPGAGAGQRLGRQGVRDRGGLRPGDRPGGAEARGRVLLQYASGAAAREGAAAGQGPGARLRLPDRRHLALDHPRYRLAHRVRLLQLPHLGAAHPDRCGAQPRQQRRTGARRAAR